MNSLDYAKLCCDTVINKFPEGEMPIVGIFHYHAGVFLHGMEEVYLLTGEKKYNDYIAGWILRYIDETGSVRGYDETTLDAKQAFNLLVRYCENNEYQPEFRIALDMAAESLWSFPRNRVGGFWHMAAFPNQMWLDGVYMAQLLAVRYGRLTNDRRYIELAWEQMSLLWKYARDSETGLMYHAWDASGKAEWANSQTGCAPEFWGRAIGWYIATAALLGELLTSEDEIGKKIIDMGTELADSLLCYQDKDSGMWYQVVDKGNVSGNWIESSCSCLFTFAILKLMRLGMLCGEKYEKAVSRAYDGMLRNHVGISDGIISVEDVCVGTGVGDFEHYINRPTHVNDLHGMGAFVLMCTEYYKTFKE